MTTTRLHPRAITAGLALVLVSCLGAPGDEVFAPDEQPLVCTGTCHDEVYVVAHEDDDLLFMSPDLLHSIRAGNAVTTVYLTAGDAGYPICYVEARERGVMRAYEQMAGLSSPQTWSASTVTTSDGRTVTYRRLPGTQIRLVFLRLVDGGNDGSVPHSLEQLWEGTVATTTSQPSAGETAMTYTAGGLVATLRAIFADRGADRIATLDSSLTWGPLGATLPDGSLREHSDHVHSALFAFLAHRAYTATHDLAIYRTYDIYAEQANVGATDETLKHDVALTYARNDTAYCPAGDVRCPATLPACPALAAFPARFPPRQYSTVRVHSGLGTADDLTGRIGGLADKCIQPSGGSTTPGAAVVLATCTTAAAQDWTLRADATVRTSAGLCLDATATGVRIQTCAGTDGQRWTLFGNGQMRGVDGRCLDLVGGSSADGTAVQLQPCGDIESQRWAVQLRPTVLRTASGTFGETDLSTTDESRWGSVRFGDVSGDGLADVCARRATGVWCALRSATTGSFGTPVQWTTQFSGASWATAATGATMQLVRLNADAYADVCFRSGAGIHCAASNGSSFAAPIIATTAFGASWDTTRSYFGSIHFADVTGDGLDDVCGRGSAGIVCANNLGGFFGPLHTMTTEFSDDAGWYPDAYGTTIQLADVNADGRADVCGRGVRGIVCATANATATAFVDSHVWSSAFADAPETDTVGDADDPSGADWETYASFYRSIRLGDVNGDGRVDVCGRGARALVCAYGTGGTHFDAPFAWMPRDYGDTEGWGPVHFGATLQLVDMDADGAADVCGRGSMGIVCARGRP